MIYTIKPLEWEGNISMELTAWTPFGRYDIIEVKARQEWDSPVALHYCFDEHWGGGVINADSVEHAKELAWQDWTKRLEGALMRCVDGRAKGGILIV